MSSPKKKKEIHMDIPDLSWLATLSDSDYVKLKRRYADFASFIFRILIKEMMKVEMLSNNQFKEVNKRLAKQIVEELVRDRLLSKSALKETSY
jgi:hypothetical protein